MSFDVNWDINKYREEHESDDHWLLRRDFMNKWKHTYPEERLVCLARVFANMEFMGCRYPQEVMQEVAKMSKEVKKNLTYFINDFNANNFIDDGRSIAQYSTSVGFTLSKHATEAGLCQVSTSNVVHTTNIRSGVGSALCQKSTVESDYACSQHSSEVKQELVNIPKLLQSTNSESFIHVNLPKQTFFGNLTWHKSSRNNVHQSSVIRNSPDIHCNPDIGISQDQTIKNEEISDQKTNTYSNPCVLVDSLSAMNSSEPTTSQESERKSNKPPVVSKINNLIDSENKKKIAGKTYKKKIKCRRYKKENQLKGAKCKRYKFWIHVGKSHQEARELCETRLSKIPEYKEIKKTMGSSSHFNTAYLKFVNKNWPGRHPPPRHAHAAFEKIYVPELKKFNPAIALIDMSTTAGVTTRNMGAAASKASASVKKVQCKNVNASINHIMRNLGITSAADKTTFLKEYQNRLKFWQLCRGKSKNEARSLSLISLQNYKKVKQLKAKSTETMVKKLAHKEKFKQFIKPITRPEVYAIDTSQIKEEVSQIKEEPKDPDVIEIYDEKDTILTDAGKKQAAKIRIAEKVHQKRLIWWMQQGKTEEEAAVLCQNPMAISDALDKISKHKEVIDKERLDKNIPLKARTQNDETSISIPTHHENIRVEIKKSELRENYTETDDARNIKLSGNMAKEDQSESPLVLTHQGNSNSKIPEPLENCIKTENAHMLRLDENKFEIIDEIKIPTIQVTKKKKKKKKPHVTPNIRRYSWIFVPIVPESGPLLKPIETLIKMHQQNPTVGCDTWIILHAQMQRDGQLLYVRFGYESEKVLKSLNYKLKWYSSRPLRVKLKNRTELQNNSQNYKNLVKQPLLSAPKMHNIMQNMNPRPVEYKGILNPVDISSYYDMSLASEINAKKAQLEVIRERSIEWTKQSNQATSSAVDQVRHVSPQLENANKQEITESRIVSELFPESRVLRENRSETGLNLNLRENRSSAVKYSRTEDNAGFWGIDAPRLLPAHRAVMTKVDFREYDNYRESAASERETGYTAFVERDEEYSLEERVFAERKQKCSREEKDFNEEDQEYSRDRVVNTARGQEDYRTVKNLAHPDKEYSRGDRVFDERDQDTSQGRVVTEGQKYFRDNTVFGEADQGTTQGRVVTERSQEYTWGDRVFDERDQGTSQSRVVTEGQGYFRVGVFGAGNQGTSQSIVVTEPGQEYSWGDRVFDERDQGTSQSRVVTEPGQEYSWRDRVFDERDQGTSQGRVVTRRHQNNYREVRDLNEQDQICSQEDKSVEVDHEHFRTDRGFDERDQGYSQEENVFAGQYKNSREHKYSQEPQNFNEPGQEYTRQQRDFDERDQEYSRQDKDFYERHEAYIRENRVLTGGVERENRLSAERGDQKYSRKGSVFNRLDQQNLRVDRGFDKRNQNYYREDRDCYQRDMPSSAHSVVEDGLGTRQNTDSHTHYGRSEESVWHRDFRTSYTSDGTVRRSRELSRGKGPMQKRIRRGAAYRKDQWQKRPKY